MASPFSIFRKNQRLMFALLTVMVMFGFIFIPILMETMDTRSTKDPVVVKTKFGNLREYDLNNLVVQRRKVQGILAGIMERAGENPNMVQQWLESQMGPATEEAVVTSWVMARTAEQQGMVVSDNMVNEYLRQMTGNRVKSAAIAEVIRRSGMSEIGFFVAMRDELVAQQFDRMFQVGLNGFTPAERWDYFCRGKQMAMVEAVAVPVENFLPQIDDPTEEELKQFFEANKDSLSPPNSPEPGFRQPQKVALEWLKAEAEKFSSPDLVTDAEIKERYEKNKEFYDPPKEKSPEAEKPAADAAKPAADPKAMESTPAEPAKEPADEKKEPAAEGKSGDTSSVDQPSPFRLTSFLDEEKPAENAPAAEAKPAEAKPAETPAAVAPAATAEKPAETPAVATPAASAETPAAAVPAVAAPAAAAATPAEAKPEMAEATKNRIRMEIAREKVQKIFEKINARLEQYRREQSKHEIVKQDKAKEGVEAPAAPARPDLEKLASENGLTVGRMDLSTQWEVQPSDIGATYVAGRTPAWIFVFQSMPKYRAEVSFDLQGNQYLLWSVDEQKERVPAFDDEGVRERVLREWKMLQARKLAQEKAEAMVAEARKSEKPLKEVFPDAQVITPPAFSWLTSGSVAFSATMRISDVPGVIRPGEDFMKAVFHSNVGGVASAFNAPKTVVYVVRPAEFLPSRDVLWEQFEVDDFRKYASAAQSDRQQVMRAWLEQLRKAAGVEWKRKADQHDQGGQSERD